MGLRCCSRTACKHPPVYTLTYVYRDSNAVMEARPAVRSAAEPVGQGVEVGRRGHLRVLRSGPPQDR